MLLVILIAQVAIAIYAFVTLKNNPNLKADIREEYATKVFKQYGTHPDSTEIVDDLQIAVSLFFFWKIYLYHHILKSPAVYISIILSKKFMS